MADPTSPPPFDPDDDDDPWGPFRERMAERLEVVGDYLGRCRRSLAGEIAPDRHYFTTKACELRDAALALTRDCRNVERWLGECGELYDASALHDDGVSRWLAPCARPAGHGGDHDEDPPATPGERAADAADALAASMVEAADCVRWATIALDHGSDPDAGAVLRMAAGLLHQLREGADRLLPHVAALAGDHQPEGES